VNAWIKLKVILADEIYLHHPTKVNHIQNFFCGAVRGAWGLIILLVLFFARLVRSQTSGESF